MSKKFNINDYPGKYVMHCKTEEEAKDFCRVLHEAGRKWKNLLGDYTGYTYLDNTNWNHYGHNTCYRFNDGLYSNKQHYLDKRYTILEWSDFMNKEFTKADLKNGDVVLTRNGKVHIYILTSSKRGFFMSEDLYTIWSDKYHSDLTRNDYGDIMAVRRPDKVSDMSFDAFEKNLGRLVYERDETVEMTLEEVCKALGKNVKIVKE